MGRPNNHFTSDDQAEIRRLGRMIQDSPPPGEPDITLRFPMRLATVIAIMGACPEGSVAVQHNPNEMQIYFEGEAD